MREQIIREIRRLAEASDGQPPGRRLFETETGIREAAWFGVYWARWGDALAEAGYPPNIKHQKLDEHFILQKLADVSRHYGKVPSTMEMRLYKRIAPDFPNEKTILSHFGGKQNLLRRLAEWTRQHDELQGHCRHAGSTYPAKLPRPPRMRPKRVSSTSSNPVPTTKLDEAMNLSAA